MPLCFFCWQRASHEVMPAMRVQMKFYDYEIHPGTYTLNTSMSSKKMLQILNEKVEEEEDIAS